MVDSEKHQGRERRGGTLNQFDEYIVRIQVSSSYNDEYIYKLYFTIQYKHFFHLLVPPRVNFPFPLLLPVALFVEHFSSMLLTGAQRCPLSLLWFRFC